MEYNTCYKGSEKLAQIMRDKELEYLKWLLLLKINTWLLRAKDMEGKLFHSWLLNLISQQRPVWFSMVKKQLRSAELSGSITIKKLLLQKRFSRKNCYRLEGIKDKTLKERQNELWTDKYQFGYYDCERIVYVRRKLLESLNNEWVLPTIKHSVGFIIKWVFFRRREGCRVHSDQEKHEKKNNIIRFCEDMLYHLVYIWLKKKITFQQENDSEYTFKLCQNYLCCM